MKLQNYLNIYIYVQLFTIIKNKVNLAGHAFHIQPPLTVI